MFESIREISQKKGFSKETDWLLKNNKKFLRKRMRLAIAIIFALHKIRVMCCYHDRKKIDKFLKILEKFAYYV